MSSTQDVGSSNFVSLTNVDYWRPVIVESGDTHNFRDNRYPIYQVVNTSVGAGKIPTKKVKV